MPPKKKLFTIQEEIDGEGSDTYEESRFEEQKWVKENFKDEFELFRYFFKHVKASRYITELAKEANFKHEKCELFQVTSTTYPLNNPYPPKLPRVELPNKSFSNATKNVGLQYSKEKGRHLVCERTMKIGYIIISEIPKILYSPPNCLCIRSPIYQCHHCSKTLLLFLQCNNCELCVYCSFECRFDAWMAYHRWECDGLARHYWRNSQEAHLAFRMLMTGISENFNVGEKEFQNDYGVDCHKYGMSKNQYKFLYKLSFSLQNKTKAQLNKILLDATRTLVYLVERTNFFEFIISRKCFTKLSLYECYMRIGGMLVRHECQVMSNVIYLSQFDSSEKMFGTTKIYDLSALCITATMINHSCVGNAVAVINQNRVIVKALRKIKKGEEITINYNLDVYNTPMRYSQDCNDFNCSCSLCFLPSSSEQYYLAYKCRNCKGRVVKPEYVCLKCAKIVNAEKVLYGEAKALVHEKLYEIDHSHEHIQKMIDIRGVFLHESNLRMAEMFYEMGKCLIYKKFSKTIVLFESMNKVYEKSFSSYAPLVLTRKLEYCHLVLARMSDLHKRLSHDDIEFGIQFLKKIKRQVKFYYLTTKEHILKQEMRRLKRQLQLL